MSLRIAPVPLLVFISLAIVFFVKMSWQTSDRFFPAGESADPNTAGQAAAESPAEAPAARVVGEPGIIDRNIFSQGLAGANKGTAVTEPSAALPETSLDLVLMGVIDSGSRDSRAVILSKNDKKQQLYKVGDVVAGAQIQSILWGKVVLRANGREEVLGMSEAASYRLRESAVPVPPPAAPATLSQQKKSVSSSVGGDLHDRLIPERVRLALPDQEPGGNKE